MRWNLNKTKKKKNKQTKKRQTNNWKFCVLTDVSFVINVDNLI